MPLLAIARNAFLESIRQPVFVVVILAGILALVLNVNLAAFTLEDDNKLLIDLGLSTLFLTGLLLAAFTATSVLSREIDNKTVLAVVSKPVSRPALVIGKYLGVAAALLCAHWSLSMVFLLSVRHRVQAGEGMGDVFDMPVLVFGLLAGALAAVGSGLSNYLYRRPFPSVFVVSLAALLAVAVGLVWCIDREWRFQDPRSGWDGQVMIALALVLEAVLVLAAVAIASSTRLAQTSTLLTCIGVFLIGLVSEYFMGTVVAQPGGRPAWLVMVCWPLYAMVPNLQFFWPADALTQGHAMTTAYLGTVTTYAACMTTAMLALAVLLFQERDVG
jgi:ABC-2 type transport system permease protein